MAGKKRSMSTDADSYVLHKEWEEALCPICMDHPHNAVLLLCSSYGKGCRPYICDTSYRHSNCLDRFKKLKLGSSENPLPTRSVPTSQVQSGSQVSFDNELVGVDYSGGDENRSSIHERLDGRLDATLSASKISLKCPLCRGNVLGWNAIEEARAYLNLKRRSCSRESCSFSGNYLELRSHARRVHPSARPGKIDPSRERAWRRLESQREHDDIVSAVQSAMPGAVVLGDYAIEDSEALGDEREGDIDGPLMTTFFLLEMLGSVDREPRSRSRTWTGHRRPSSTAPSGRRYHWGENLLGLRADDEIDLFDDDDDELIMSRDLDEDASPIPRRRRRLTRSRYHRD
ncbi:hypothetical protein Dimus_016564 [Dionaea muscipula]